MPIDLSYAEADVLRSLLLSEIAASDPSRDRTKWMDQLYNKLMDHMDLLRACRAEDVLRPPS